MRVLMEESKVQLIQARTVLETGRNEVPHLEEKKISCYTNAPRSHTHAHARTHTCTHIHTHTHTPETIRMNMAFHLSLPLQLQTNTCKQMQQSPSLIREPVCRELLGLTQTHSEENKKVIREINPCDRNVHFGINGSPLASDSVPVYLFSFLWFSFVFLFVCKLSTRGPLNRACGEAAHAAEIRASRAPQRLRHRLNVEIAAHVEIVMGRNGAAQRFPARGHFKSLDGCWVARRRRGAQALR